MKKIFIVCILLILNLFLIDIVYAASGCCSSHGGVNCNKIQSNGKVVCNDGWTSSSCDYSSMVKCKGYTPSTYGAVKQTPTYVYGCTDKSASNYNPKANKNNGSCIYYVYGCTDKSAKNYNAKANKDNGSCVNYIYGCTDKNSINYDTRAEKDDGSCIEKVYGCIDNMAINYNSKANVNDDNCEYSNDNSLSEISNKSDKDNEMKSKKESVSDSNDVGSTIVGLGILGSIGYFVIKKIKK